MGEVLNTPGNSMKMHQVYLNTNGEHNPLRGLYLLFDFNFESHYFKQVI